MAGVLHAISAGIQSGVHSLQNLTRPQTIENLISRLEDGNLPVVQSRACNSLAKQAKESAEQSSAIKQAGGVDALESLYNRSHHQSVKVAALEALVALQAKAAVVPLVQIMQSQPSSGSPVLKHKDTELKNWAADSLHQLLLQQGSFQKVARDAGAVPAIIKLERRDSTKELLHILGPEDSHRVRSSRTSRASSSAASLNIPAVFTEEPEIEPESDAALPSEEPQSTVGLQKHVTA